MSNVDIKWNRNWKRDLKREVERNTKRQYQDSFDRLGAEYEGRPKDEIRAAIIRELQLDGDPSDEWVDAIHDGTRIVIEFEWD